MRVQSTRPLSWQNAARPSRQGRAIAHEPFMQKYTPDQQTEGQPSPGRPARDQDSEALVNKHDHRNCAKLGPLLLALCLLAGCATGVVPMGQDTYMVAHKGSAWSSVSGLKADCLRDANRFCEKKGLALVVVSSSGNNGGFGVFGNCEVIFMAVPESGAGGGPEAGQPATSRVSHAAERTDATAERAIQQRQPATTSATKG